MRIIHTIGKPRYMRWFRRLYCKVTGTWHWGIIPFINEMVDQKDIHEVAREEGQFADEQTYKEFCKVIEKVFAYPDKPEQKEDEK